MKKISVSCPEITHAEMTLAPDKWQTLWLIEIFENATTNKICSLTVGKNRTNLADIYQNQLVVLTNFKHFAKRFNKSLQICRLI